MLRNAEGSVPYDGACTVCGAQTADFDGNGQIDVDDAIYLLQHVLMPDLFPL